MIHWNKVTWYSQILAIVLAIVIFCAGLYVGNMQIPSIEPSGTAVTTDENLKQITPSISFTGLDLHIKELPPMPSNEVWQEVLNNSIFKERFEEDTNKYGEFMKRYYSDNEYSHFYIKVIEADLTSDGVLEKIVSFDGGGSYGVERYEIVQGDKVIATIKTPSVGRGGVFLPDASGNGFSITWYQEDMFPNGFCCPIAHKITRFVFEDGIFKPVYEQMILNS